jgi:intracellular multiplication protein IcmQ
MMKDELTKEQTDAILKALDDAIDGGPWEESNFLKVIGKNLREIRERFVSQLDFPDRGKGGVNLANRIALRSGQQEIFIALYSVDGNNVHSWERILANLPKQMIARAIYAEEKSAQDMIKSKENKVNEAYVSIFVSKENILPSSPDKLQVDKLGNPILSLKDKALSLDNINHFVHVTGRYKYHVGRLTKIHQESP